MILVFKRNGPHWGPPGIKYDSKGVRPEELEEALAQGWHPDFLVALGLVDARLSDQPAADHPAETQDDNSAPTRAELEQKATELKIKFDGRTSDARLAEKIAESQA